MRNFHPLEVVGRGSETQLQVGENLNDLISALVVKTCMLWCIKYHLLLKVEK